MLIGEMNVRRIRPQSIATAKQAAEILHNNRAADNFRNLFELPVMFYVACVLMMVMQTAAPVLVGLAWLFVVLRALHSLIHCTYNRVMHRFFAYIASSLLLWLLWLMLGFVLLTHFAL